MEDNTVLHRIKKLIASEETLYSKEDLN